VQQDDNRGRWIALRKKLSISYPNTSLSRLFSLNCWNGSQLNVGRSNFSRLSRPYDERNSEET